MGVCNCSMFCCTLLYVHSSFAIIMMGKRELADLLRLSSWFLATVVWHFLAVPWLCLQFVIVAFPGQFLVFLERPLKTGFTVQEAFEAVKQQAFERSNKEY